MLSSRVARFYTIWIRELLWMIEILHDFRYQTVGFMVT